MNSVVPFKRPAAKNKNAVGGGANVVTPTIPPGVIAVGIDLGTTNSVVSIYGEHQKQPETLIYDGEALVPSMLYFDESQNAELVGKLARDRNDDAPDQVIKSTKRLMGAERASFESCGRFFKPEEVAERVLRFLSAHPSLASEQDKFGKLHAVITVPAHFDDAARQATIVAAQNANIEVLRIVNEPTAAALAYSMLPDMRETQKEILAVYDFGGGTFDVSIVERDGLIFNVLSSEGDVKLGGDDIDASVADHLRAFVSPILVAKRATDRSALFGKLLHHAEAAKRTLLFQGEVVIKDDDLDGKGSKIDTVLTRETFESIAAPLISRTLELTERALHAAKKRPGQLSRVLLVGGSSRLSLVHAMLEEHFDGCFIDGRLEPDLAVSWGAAAQSAIILGLEPETILVDVCSHSLGIGVAEDSRSVQQNFKKIAVKFGLSEFLSDQKIAEVLGDRIHDFNRELLGSLRVAHIVQRNSPLPARRSEFFSTLYKDQFAVQVVVVQGEELTVSKNRLLGSFLFKLQQPCPVGTRCEIQLTYDVNGMVQVFAKQIGTDNISRAEFDSRTGEVKGWSLLESEVLPLLDELSFESANEGVEPEQDQPVSVNNAILVRARRGLMRIRDNNELTRNLSNLIANYERELHAAAKGQNNDNVLDDLEDKIEAVLETCTQ